DDGIVSLSQRPGNTFSPTLLVTGGTSKAVLKGVRKLIEGRFQTSSAFARISQDAITTPLLPREWRGFVPPHNHFTLSDMGLKELKFDSQNNFSTSLPLLATPDTQFLEYGHQMTLAFRFNSDARFESAGVDIGLNGISLGRFQAAEISTGSRTSV